MYLNNLENTKLRSFNIATVVAKYFNGASIEEISNNPSYLLLDSGTDESSLNKILTKYRKHLTYFQN